MKIALYLLFLLSSIPIFTFAYFDETDSIFAETDYQSDEWWAPSRKASTYSQKYKSAIKMASKMMAEGDDQYRLPDDVVPFDYLIQLTPIIEPGNFTTIGYVAIEVNCIRDTNSIVLNAADLTITPYTVQVQDSDSLDYLRIGEIVDEQEEKERITIPISPPGLEAGKKYKISMKFVSNLNDELRGLYRSSYEENGATKYHYHYNSEILYRFGSDCER